MSFFKKLIRGAGNVVKTVAQVAGSVGALPGVGSLPGLGMIGRVPPVQGILPGLGSLPALGRALPAIGQIAGGLIKSPGIRKWSRRAAKAAGYVISGIYVYDIAGNIVGEVQRSRRINPLNARALNRAMKRVCKARDIAKKVEKISSCAPKRRRSC